MSADAQFQWLQPGSLVAGKYNVERVLGEGGMGVVVAARHSVLGQRVALKFLLPELTYRPELSQRFLREAKAVAQLQSEHVTRVMDVGALDWGGLRAPYLVMEYLEGEDLGALLDREGPLDQELAVDYVLQACAAVQEAHQRGIVHRDLKPSNLFLARRSDGSSLIKVLDFGVSRTLSDADDARLTRSQATLGSAMYMSPEQMRDPRTVDSRSDVYALGVSLFELLTGRHPFEADTVPLLHVEVLHGEPRSLATLRPDIPEGLEEVVLTSLARDKTQRVQSAQELAERLAPFAAPRSQSVVDTIRRSALVSRPRYSSAPPPVRQSIPEAPASSAASSPTVVRLASDPPTTTSVKLERRPRLSMRLALTALVLALGLLALALYVAAAGDRPVMAVPSEDGLRAAASLGAEEPGGGPRGARASGDTSARAAQGQANATTRDAGEGEQSADAQAENAAAPPAAPQADGPGSGTAAQSKPSTAKMRGRTGGKPAVRPRRNDPFATR